MKTATLTIEVPDNFAKNKCNDCILDDYGYELCPFDYDCPLEIQIEYDTNEFSEREIAQMKAGRVISHRPKENNQ